jgi:hypothetical protein
VLENIMNPMKPLTGINLFLSNVLVYYLFYVVFKIKVDNISHMFNAPRIAGIIGHVARLFL